MLGLDRTIGKSVLTIRDANAMMKLVLVQAATVDLLLWMSPLSRFRRVDLSSSR